ncbi:MAG: hypothetical protein O3A47_05815 [Chloroflexi bacterium]|nr:hypothetical protein [Chloroflexota bacterium]
MTLFFDRDVGISLPKALLELKLPTPVEYHQQYFEIDELDDVWMPQVGSRGWMLIGHDSRHHVEPAELSAVKQYDMACFYLWGSHAKRWEKALCFLRAYPAILEADRVTTRPYIFLVTETGLLRPVPVP